MRNRVQKPNSATAAIAAPTRREQADSIARQIRELKPQSPEFASLLAQLRTFVYPLPKDRRSILLSWRAHMCVYANGLIRSRNPQEALKVLSPLVAEGGLLDDYIVAYNTYATALNKSGRYEDAVEWLMPRMAAGGILGQDKLARTTYANALINMGKPEEAIKLVEALIASGGLLEKDPYAYTVLANAYIKNDDPEKAICLIKPLLGAGCLLETDHFAHNVHAHALIQAGRPAEAVAALEPLVVQPGSAREVEAAEPLPEPAAEERQFTLAYNPVSINALAHAYIRAGRPQDAAKLLWPLLQRGRQMEKSVSAYAYYAQALIGMGEEQRALDWLKPQVAEGGMLEGSPVAVRLIAEVLIQREQYHTAEQLLLEVVGKRDYGICFSLARIEVLRLNGNKAFPHLMEAAQKARGPQENSHCFALMQVANINHAMIPVVAKALRSNEKRKATQLAKAWREDPARISVPPRFSVLVLE
ncbi:MAG: hypothetical protein EBX50_16090 [Chitinophagia bacterium]|nr:hypothetical protein [Chitinophagia bacterium]